MYFQKLGVSNGSTTALPTVHVVYIFAKWFESFIALLMDSTNSICDHLFSFVNFSNFQYNFLHNFLDNFWDNFKFFAQFFQLKNMVHTTYAGNLIFQNVLNG